MNSRPYSQSLASLILMSIVAFFIFTDSAFSQAEGCNYYASPTGTGNGLTQSSPFKISNFWSVARAGLTLCLLDGTYKGSDSMITPPQNLSGASDNAITIRAVNDGKVLINGQGAGTAPVRFVYNDWFVVEGINACCSDWGWSVVEVAVGSHNTFRRIAAWDSGDGNVNIFGVHHGDYNLLEDVAGWGVARKTFSPSQQTNFTTIRRAWGRWEGSMVVGPKATYELVYYSYDITVENAIGTWSGEKMKQSYVLLDYDGNPYTGYGSTRTLSNYGVDQPDAIFTVAGDGKVKPRAKLLGSIAYVTPMGMFHPGQLVLSTNIPDQVEIANTVAYIPPGASSSVKPFNLYDLGAATNLVARNLTSIGGQGSSMSSNWQKTNILSGSSVSSIYNSGENIFNTSRGANLCYRYQDRVLTKIPLWPWPMNQRIKDAMIASGRSPVDVTATIESMFGPIPATCKSTGTTTAVSVSKPSAPINLQAQPQ